MKVKVFVKDGKVLVDLEGFSVEYCGLHANEILKKLAKELEMEANVREKREGESSGVTV